MSNIVNTQAEWLQTELGLVIGTERARQSNTTDHDLMMIVQQAEQCRAAVTDTKQINYNRDLSRYHHRVGLISVSGGL